MIQGELTLAEDLMPAAGRYLWPQIGRWITLPQVSGRITALGFDATGAWVRIDEDWYHLGGTQRLWRGC